MCKGTGSGFIIRKEWWKCGGDRPYGFLIKRLIKINNAFFQKPSHYSKGITQDIEQLMDQDVYPKYAVDPENIEKVWGLCVSLTSNPVSRV
ncbi:hypothetical protein J7I80_11390 [Bacillus sp. ISL-41]|uniref:hypothetical protein n=1 Tax=Bacillus sp. ISL-41 TaxID=2819127 RepID=UPI001BE6EE00|nr:hypothetical protein [Bacillus sp. ISL-41]MBT2642833.1 hypothetical protein [Bacillus sp. ISL-41]